MTKEKSEAKILQIMPAPPGMQSVWYGSKSGHVFTDPVVCLALVQDGDFTFVMPLEFDAETGVYNDAVTSGKADTHLGYLMVGTKPDLDYYEKEARKRLTGPE